LDFFIGGKTFEIALNFSALGIIGMWIMIMVANLGLQRRAKQGIVPRPQYRLPGAPYTNYLTIVFLVAVFALSWYDDPAGRIMIIGSPGIAILMIIGWFAVRKRVGEVQRRPLPGQRTKSG
jgi:L-asparagine permease